MKNVTILVIICAIGSFVSGHAFASHPQGSIADEIARVTASKDYKLYKQFIPDFKGILASFSGVLLECGEADCITLQAQKIPRKVTPLLPDLFPVTYGIISDLAEQTRINKPVLFLADAGPLSKTVSMVTYSENLSGIFLGKQALIERTDDEIRALILHEIGHIVYRHRDKKKRMATLTPAFLGVFLGGYLALSYGKKVYESSKNFCVDHGLEICALGALSGLVLLVGSLVNAAYGRRCERAADRFAWRYLPSDKKQALAASLRKFVTAERAWRERKYKQVTEQHGALEQLLKEKKEQFSQKTYCFLEKLIEKYRPQGMWRDRTPVSQLFDHHPSCHERIKEYQRV